MKLWKPIAFVVAATAAIACKNDKPAPQATAESAPAPLAIASAAPSASSAHAHRSCPSRVHGASATATDVDGGVMIAVTAGDDATISEIHTRAAALGTAVPEGRRGRFCPEMVEGTTRTVASTKTGAEITIVPTTPSDVARVRTDVRERLSHSEKRPD